METNRALAAAFRVVTPMFLGGAGHEVSGFRPAAFKGALRFWWRALEYRRLAAGREPGQALAALQARERWLFGAAAAGDQPEIGQSRLLIHAAPSAEPIQVLAKGAKLVRHEAMPGVCYLGYGLMGAFGAKGGVLERTALAPGQRFEVEIRFKREVEALDRASVGRALRLLGLLGGLGSRVRRGWGSLAIERLEGDVDGAGNDRPFTPPTTAAGYARMLAEVIGAPDEAGDGLPPFTALSGFSRVDLVAAGEDPVRLLDQVGRQMQRYRAWGFNGRVNGEASERNFEDDHDWFKDAVNGRVRPQAPRRAAFGLPHNYYSAKERRGANVDPDGLNRRASPLLIHIHALGGTSHIAVLALLPAVFLPNGRLAMKAGRERTTAPLGEGWLHTLHGFIDGRSKASGAPYFPERIAVITPRVRSLAVADGGGR